MLASGAEPTGTSWVDPVYLMVFGAVTTLAASRARRRVLVVSGALVSVATAGFGGVWGVAGVCGLVAFALAVVMAIRDIRTEELSAVVGALLATAMVRIDLEWVPHGGSLVAGVVSVVLVVSGVRNSPRLTRRRINRVLSGCAGVLVLGAGLGGLAGWFARSPVAEAADRTTEAVELAGDGRTDEAAELFGRARSEFDSAASTTGAWWTAPAALVPVISQNLDAVDAAANAGALLSGTAARITEEVSYDRLRREGGGVDLAVLAEFRAPVVRAAAELRRAEFDLRALDSPWLLGPLADRLEVFRGKVADVLDETEIAELAVQHAPGILGSGGPRRYLVLLGNPAELRDVGGHIGNWAELVVDEGVLDLVEVGGPLELSRPEGEAALRDDPIRYPPSLVALQPARYPQNWGGTPDFGAVARVSADLFEQKVGRVVDGVIYADPAALAAIMEITGPVPVAGLAEPLRAEQAVAFLTEDQFALYGDDDAADAALQGFITDVFDRFTSVKLPGPRRMSELFTPVVRSGRLRFVSLRSGDGNLLRRMGLDTDTTADPGQDLLAVVNRNANPSKIDAFLRRSSRYDVVWDPATGRIEGRVRIELSNDAPSENLPPVVIGNGFEAPPGTNRTDVSIVTPLGLVGAVVDGEVVSVGSIDEGRLRRHTVRVTLEPGQTRTVEFRITGELASGPRYRLAVVGQPMLQESPLEVVVRSTGAAIEVPPGSRRAADGVHTTFVGALRRDLELFTR